MLNNFTQELERQKASLDYHQVWRYTKKGKMPKVLLWVASNPKLAAALARDAKELARQQAEGKG